MKIHLRCFRGFVPQPERDHRAINTMLKKVHGCRVTTDVRRYSLPFEREADLSSKMGVLSDETLDRIPAKFFTTNTGEDRIFRLTVAFAQPRLKHLGRFRAQWRATLFSSFPEAAHVGTCPQNDILAFQPNQLGNSKAGLDRNQKEGSIAMPHPCGAIRDGE